MAHTGFDPDITVVKVYTPQDGQIQVHHPVSLTALQNFQLDTIGMGIDVPLQVTLQNCLVTQMRGLSMVS